MNRNRIHTLRAVAITTTLIFNAYAHADGDGTQPSSAADVGGNTKSFFGKLGTGVAIRKPYAAYDVVSRGVVPGRGPGYCLHGEPMPHLESASNQVNLALVPCKTLEESGAHSSA